MAGLSGFDVGSCCCPSGDCVITVAWLKDAGNRICRVVVGATVTAYDAGGGVIDSQTTDDNGQVAFSLETCRTAYTIIAAKGGYTACGTGVDRLGHGGYPGLSSILYLFPVSLAISCGGAGGSALVNVDVSFGIAVSWVYSVVMGPGGSCCILGPYGVFCECGHGSSGVGLSFRANMTGGLPPSFQVVEGAPLGDGHGVWLGCYKRIQLLDFAGSGSCHQWFLDGVSMEDCEVFFPYVFRSCGATLACPTGSPVAWCTIPDYPVGIGGAYTPAMVSGTIAVAAP